MRDRETSYSEVLFTFVLATGVEPTNNAAERALRGAVIWRKISFGTDSERGCRFPFPKLGELTQMLAAAKSPSRSYGK